MHARTFEHAGSHNTLSAPCMAAYLEGVRYTHVYSGINSMSDSVCVCLPMHTVVVQRLSFLYSDCFTSCCWYKGKSSFLLARARSNFFCRSYNMPCRRNKMRRKQAGPLQAVVKLVFAKIAAVS